MHGVTPLIGRNFTKRGNRSRDRSWSRCWATATGNLATAAARTSSARRSDSTRRSRRSSACCRRGSTRRRRSCCRCGSPLAEYSRRGTGRVSVYARLRPDVTIDQAKERLSARMPIRTLPNGQQTSNPRVADQLAARVRADLLAHHGQRAGRIGRADSADRVRQRRGPAARARRRPAVRARGARVAGRGTRPFDAAAADGERGARADWRRAWRAARVALARRDRRQRSAVDADQLARDAQLDRPRRDARAPRADRAALRVVAGHPAVARAGRIRARAHGPAAGIGALAARRPAAHRRGSGARRDPRHRRGAR